MAKSMKPNVPVHSSVFEERCTRERKKLQAKLSHQLQLDMGRLFDDGLHSDLTFKLHGGHVRAHHFILRIRCNLFYQKLMKQADIFLDRPELDIRRFSSFLRYLYTTEHVTSLVTEFEHYLDDVLQLTDCGMPVQAPSLVTDLANENLIQNLKIDEQNESFVSTKLSQQVSNDNGGEVSNAYEGEVTMENKTVIQDMTVDSASENIAIQCVEVSSNYDNLPETEASVQNGACSGLGEDLLKVYQHNLDSDCLIAVTGRHFQVHSCILATRSEYFHAMLNGSWRESEAMTLTLEGVSAGVVEQILLYLYGGVIDKLDTCSFAELIMVADMYGMEGLKEVVNYLIKKQLCHFFHKPCATCISGCTEALAAAVAFNLEEIKEKCLRWINKNLAKVWPTKNFSTLPQNVLDMCCSELVENLTVESVIDVMLESKKIEQSVPRLKWAEPVIALVTRLMEAAVKFTCDNLMQLLSSRKFLTFDKSMALSLDVLQNIFKMVFKSLHSDRACEAFLCLDSLKQTVHTEGTDMAWTEDFQQFVGVLCSQCEDYMKLHIHQVVHSKDWELLSKDLQTKLLQAASYVCVDSTSSRKVLPPKLSSMEKVRTSQPTQSVKKNARPTSRPATGPVKYQSAKLRQDSHKRPEKLPNRLNPDRSVKAATHNKETVHLLSEERQTLLPENNAPDRPGDPVPHDVKSEQQISSCSDLLQNGQDTSEISYIKIMPIFDVKFEFPVE